MFRRSPVQAVFARPGLSEDSTPRRLPSPKQFRQLLERERARTDRSGDEFALLLFGAPDLETDRVTFRHLGWRLEQRLRIPDEAGWFDSRHLGVILPNTPGWGAWTVADELCLGLPDDVPQPECEVFVYPSYWPSAPDGSEHPLKEPLTSLDRTRSVRTMEWLFAKRMPLWKRVLDVLGASVGLILLWPLLLAIAVAVKLESAGPVLFAQTRGGRGGKPFRMFKFRSMIVDAEAYKHELLSRNEREGPAFKVSDDPRVTAVGRWLRKTSLDELPQLWNVLKGDMSLVGPRPLPCDESDACRGWHRRRLDVTPGLTCTWQVNGRSTVSFTQWMRMDAGYVRRMSLWHDLKLLLKTVPAVLLGRNE